MLCIFNYYLIKSFGGVYVKYGHTKIDMKDIIFPYLLFTTFSLSITHIIGFLV